MGVGKRKRRSTTAPAVRAREVLWRRLIQTYTPRSVYPRHTGRPDAPLLGDWVGLRGRRPLEPPPPMG
eukprot:5400093-Pleurochrysis_carterae.AAC.1